MTKAEKEMHAQRITLQHAKNLAMEGALRTPDSPRQQPFQGEPSIDIDPTGRGVAIWQEQREPERAAARNAFPTQQGVSSQQADPKGGKIAQWRERFPDLFPRSGVDTQIPAVPQGQQPETVCGLLSESRDLIAQACARIGRHSHRAIQGRSDKPAADGSDPIPLQATAETLFREGQPQDAQVQGALSIVKCTPNVTRKLAVTKAVRRALGKRVSFSE